jgi:HK97 family phage prohead protease
MPFIVKTLDPDVSGLSVKADAGRPLVISGIASTFGDPPDTDNDVIAPGAFTESLAWWQSNGWMPPMYWRHMPSGVIGKWREIRETDAGLEVVGEFTPGHSLADDIAASVRHGAVRGLSVGMHISKASMRADGVRVIERAHLHEISVCAVPANLGAKIGPMAIKTIRQFEELLRGIGFSRRDATAIATGGFARLRREAEGAEKDRGSHRDDASAAWRRVEEQLAALAAQVARIEVPR